MEESVNKFEEALREIPPIYIDGPKDAGQQKNVAQLKRLLECYLHDPAFRDAFKNDPGLTLGRYGIEAEPAVAQMLLDPDSGKAYARAPEKVPLAIKQFYAFFAEKLQWRNISQMQDCVPEHPAFKKWRQRQVNRCWGEFAGSNIDFIHVPLVFELSLGCSVGCPFCALASQQLEKVFKATAGNLELWHAVLSTARKIIGPAAGEGVCYCANEPLDNPDYEIFSAVYRELLGKTPQITTAAAMRDPERTRNLLRESLSGPPIIHRFSILDLQTFRAICNFFTPEELLYVELLARYDESLTNVITKAGRSLQVETGLGQEEDVANTISCASGFIVNMAEKSIRLSTPCNADVEHPTGEITTGRFYFNDAADFERLLLQIIAEEMPLSMDMQKTLRFQKFYSYEETPDGFILHGAAQFAFKLKEEQTPRFYQEVGRILKEGTCSGREIASAVHEKTGAEMAVIFNFLRYLDNAGALQY